MCDRSINTDGRFSTAGEFVARASMCKGVGRVLPRLFSDHAAAQPQPAAALPQPGPRVEIDSDEKMNDNDSIVSESSPANVRRYRWVQETGPSRRELCVAWLKTESVKRVIDSNFKLRFNGDLDSNLQLFATSNNNNDSLVDLKREARLYLGEQRAKALESTGAATTTASFSLIQSL